MGAPNQSVCSSWATIADVCSPCDDYDFDTLLLESNLLAASEILFHLSGKQWPGECTDTVRPVGGWDTVPWWRWRDWPQGSWEGSSAGWANVGCSCSSRIVGCSVIPEIDLGELPVTGITEVLIDGSIVDPSTYRVDEYRWLVRLTDPIDGTNEGWPCCQRLDLDTTEVGTFEVTFTFGTLPPQMGVNAAAALGCQFALACSPETVGQCTLPQRVTNIVRQGVSLTLLDPQDFIDEGRTGVYAVDLFLKAANPNKLSRPPAVLTPTMRGEKRRSGT